VRDDSGDFYDFKFVLGYFLLVTLVTLLAYSTYIMHTVGCSISTFKLTIGGVAGCFATRWMLQHHLIIITYVFAAEGVY